MLGQIRSPLLRATLSKRNGGGAVGWNPKTDLFKLKFDTSKLVYGKGASQHNTDHWKALVSKLKTASWYGTPVAVILCHYYVYKREKAHWAHWQQPEYYEWPWLSQRLRPLPWEETKKKSYFHHPMLNPIVGKGYEKPFDLKNSGWFGII